MRKPFYHYGFPALAGAFCLLLSARAQADDRAGLRHRLERGQTLAKVARQYGVPVELVLSANSELVPEHIPAGTVITIPEPPQGWAVYRAAVGDSLTSLAGRYGFPLEEGMRLNLGVDPRNLAVGQEVRLPRASLESASDDPPAKGEDATSGGMTSAQRPQDNMASASGPNGSGLSQDGATVQDGSARPSVPVNSPPAKDAGAWVEVRLADGSRAWAPRYTLLTYSRAPLPPDQLVNVAQKFRGTCYTWGGQTPNGVDCSGYVQQVFSMAGYRIPRLADDQFAATQAVNAGEEAPGDLVFFTTYLPGPSHVGIYLGKGRFVHASSSQGVTETSLDDPYFAPRFLGTRRIKDWIAAKPVQQAKTELLPDPWDRP